MIRQISSFHKNIKFYPFDTGAALHHQGTHKLWVLNNSAATLWCLLDNNTDQNLLVSEYSRIFKLNATTAKKDVKALLNDFNKMLSNQGTGSLSAPTRAKPPKLKREANSSPYAMQLAQLKKIYFNVAGHWFSLQCSHQKSAAHWRQLVKPLAGNPRSCQPITDLVVMSDTNGRLCALQDGKLESSGLEPQNIVPHLIYRVFDHICSHEQDKLLLHAAVLSKGNKALLLPGQPAAGKSTLTAALAHTGWTYMSDELAIINPISCKVAPYPMPIGIKSKSVDPLAKLIPDLITKPVHQRADNRKVRYLLPQKTKTSGSLDVRAIIFPKYSPNAKTQLTKIDPLNTLKQLSTTGSSERSLTENDIKSLITLAQKPAYNLDINNLNTAIKLIQDNWNR